MRLLGVIAASGWLLVACSGRNPVGSGERPVQFYLNTPTGGNSFGLSECSAGSVQAILVFEGSSGRQIGDYSSRATWTSDAPDIVSVAKGQLVARAPGTATVTATYLDFTASASVVVVPIQNLYITPTLTDLAPGVDQQYFLYGVFADSPVPVNLTTDAAWDLNGEDTRAFVNSASGVVHAGAASTGAPVQLFARLPNCAVEAHTQFQVSNLTDIRLDYEFTCDANGVCTPPASLPVGTSLKVRVLGDFADPSDKSHTQQNLSRAVTIQNPFDPKLLLISATDVTGDSSIIMQGTDLVSQAYIKVGLNNFEFNAQTQPVNFVTDPLLSVTVAPKTVQVMYPATAQVNAFGDFNSGLHIPITRHVAWSLTDPNAAAVNSTMDNAGLITVTNVNEDVTITALSASATQHPSDTADLQIFAKQ